VSRRIDITGKRFGRWTVLSYSGVLAPNRRALWDCLCDCGSEKRVNSSDLRRGHSKSCGCLSKEVVSNRSKKHDSGLRKLFRGYRASAKRRGYSFHLDLVTFKSITSGDCHYCGSSPHKKSIKQSEEGVYCYNGIDRKENSLGYSLENCVTCCTECNFFKRDLDYKSFLSLINRIHNKRGKFYEQPFT